MKQLRNKSSKPRFNLDGNPQDKSLQPIYLIYRYKKNEEGKTIMLKYATGQKVYRKNWDQGIHRVKPGVRLPQLEVDAINKVLRMLEDATIHIVQRNRMIDVDDFKNELDFIMGIKERPKTKSDVSLLEYVQMFIRKSTKHERTIQKYLTTQGHLRNFETFKGKCITFDQINSEFAEDFTRWLYENTDVKSQNTVSKIIANLKEFVRDAYENGYHTNAGYQSKKFSVKRIRTSKQFLELDELDQLAKHDFKQDANLDRIRDLWLIAAYSGLRYSDFSRLKKEHFKCINDIQVIELETYKGRTTKLDTEVVIPVLPELERLLEKYNYEVPKAFKEQVMCRRIKEVCKLAGIDRLVQNKKSIKGEMVEFNTPLYKQVRNHTARYTFINIMLNDYEIPAQSLCKVTGQSLEVLMGYERGDKKRNAIKVRAKIEEARSKKMLRAI